MTPIGHRSRAPRPAPQPDPDWGVLRIALLSAITTKMCAICTPFGSASTVDCARTLKLLCVMCARLPHALRQLFVRAHLSPGGRMCLGRTGEWWRDPEWMASVMSAGLRASLRLIAEASRLGPAPSAPAVGARIFDVVLGDASGFLAFGVVANSCYGPASVLTLRLAGRSPPWSRTVHLCRSDSRPCRRAGLSFGVRWIRNIDALPRRLAV